MKRISYKCICLVYSIVIRRLKPIVVAIAVTGSLLAAAHAQTNLVGVLISKEIRPFIEMADALENQLSPHPTCRIILDQNREPFSQSTCFKRLTPDQFGVMVAVGPTALAYLLDQNWTSKAVFGMVLNPEAQFKNRSPFCGISLNLAIIDKQLFVIKETLPGITRIGVLYDPNNNQKWFDRAQWSAAINGVTVVPFKVNNRTEISSMFNKRAIPKADALLFIPDKTVIEGTIIQYVITRCTSTYRIPTIGFNQFFRKSGAVLSFVVNYPAVGRQVAALVQDVMVDKPCMAEGPAYRVYLNKKVVRKLNLKLGSKLPQIVEVDE